MNDLKGEVGGFRKLLVDHGIMRDDPPRRPTQPSAPGKENVKEQRSKGQRPEKFAGAAGKGKGKGKGKSGHAPTYLPVCQELQSDSESEDGYASIAMVQPRPPGWTQVARAHSPGNSTPQWTALVATSS